MDTAVFGISLGMGFQETIPEQARLASAAGYGACFTEWSEQTEPDVDEWATAIRDCGLIFQSIHAPFGGINVMWEEGAEGDRYLDRLIRVLDACARNRVGIMVEHASIGMGRHQPTLLGVKRFGRLLEAAGERGVIVAFENTEGLEYLQLLLDEYRELPQCGFCWDTGHELCYNFSQDMMARFGDKLVATHINDNLGMENRSVMTWLDDLHLLPFDGVADWKGVVKRLDEYGYTGIYTAELTIRNKPGKHFHDTYAAWTCGEFMQRSIERLRRIMDLRD